MQTTAVAPAWSSRREFLLQMALATSLSASTGFAACAEGSTGDSEVLRIFRAGSY